MTTRLRNACFVAGLIVSASVGTMIACSPPPIGWQGAGRDQTLPEPQDVDSGSTSSGSTSSGGDQDSGSMSGDLDSGGGAGFDAGTPKDTGTPHDTGSPKDAGPDAVDSAHPGNPGQFDGGPDAPANG